MTRGTYYIFLYVYINSNIATQHQRYRMCALRFDVDVVFDVVREKNRKRERERKREHYAFLHKILFVFFF